MHHTRAEAVNFHAPITHKYYQGRFEQINDRAILICLSWSNRTKGNRSPAKQSAPSGDALGRDGRNIDPICCLIKKSPLNDVRAPEKGCYRH